MNYEEIYIEEVKIFNSIVERYEKIKENDILGSFNLMRDSLQCYNRWSSIKYDIKKGLRRGQAAETKNRLEEMCRYLREVHTTSRMIWSRAYDDLKSCREDF